MADKRIANVTGTSTTGVARGVLIERTKTPGHVLVTITGVDGKRHAATLLDANALAALGDAIAVAQRAVDA